ncbi:bifunctional nucleoside/nucleotide kinase/histidine phosphatase family protein [Halodesulfovibrio marinisediminis]|uniref:6-phosphofructo-2-kinase n=1 Tax=Halodesulfovibrio marinisediminis DSM 17456 TaxID=1121457 RepID=A0A1N6GNU0_9BACT|nr:6-phosphofructo-2-kinase/fructose-2,6-bisphosphatase [Halodesulfovibrio marinisediminis]SIO09174.1 6-phosphofructo-2-kinase [Halodesulfovibrio marinisediminis DSM 17456]
MHKLYIGMVGLPARGKTTVAAKILDGLSKEGIRTQIFNNGDLRREILGAKSSEPQFYSPTNQTGKAAREEIAVLNMNRATEFLQGDGNVAILDATNVSRHRRLTIERMAVYPILWIECINNDEELVEASILRKTKLPEFSKLTEEEACMSFKERIQYYEHIYSPLVDEKMWVAIDSLHNRILNENVPSGVPFYPNIRDILVSDWVRNLYLARHGQTEYNVMDRIGGDSSLTELGHKQAKALGEYFKGQEINYVFTSMKRRSRQTAQYVVDNMPNCTVIPLLEFDEIDAGVCENLRYAEIKEQYPDIALERSEDKYGYVYPKGEGYITLKERVDRGLKKALFLSGNAERVLIVGHQAINRMILSHFLFRRQEDVPYILVPQNSLFHIISTQQKKLFELVKFMDVDLSN